MHNLRSQALVTLLLGPGTDREALAQFLEQAGYKVLAFKNPAVFFETLSEEKPFVVVLETSALRSKLSEWVSQMHSVSQNMNWIAMAPQNQFTILASYQNRGLVEVVTTDTLYSRERLLWALDRELEKWDLRRIRQLDFVEEAAQRSEVESSKIVDFDTLLQIRLQDSALRRRPLVLGVLTLDDAEEISAFWGADTLKQVQALLPELIRLRFGVQNCVIEDQKNYILLNATTPDFLSEVQQLQTQLQEQGRERFGFRISLSGGLCEASVHAKDRQEMRRLAEEACRQMSSRGGGRVGIPKPIQGGPNGDIPQDMG